MDKNSGKYTWKKCETNRKNIYTNHLNRKNILINKLNDNEFFIIK